MKSTSVWRHFDIWLTAAVILLTTYGILAIRSAITGAPTYEDYPQRQVIWAAGGIIAMIILAGLDYRILTSSHWAIYAILVGALVLVAVTGQINNDSRRWIDLGVLEVQPSEFGRIFIVVTFAQFLARRRTEMGQFTNTLLALAYIGVPIVLVFIQPDLGMSILFILVWFVMIWMAGLPLSHFLVLSVVSIAGAIILLPNLADYQKDRLQVFLNPDALPEQAFNIEQALISVGSGGWFGKGYLQGSQSQLGFLRVQPTDFIFAVITEEMGLIFGALVILGLLVFIMLRILNIASLTTDPSGKLICVGLSSLVFFQTIFAVGMNLRLVPVAGQTLPFVSYGGSSLVTLFMAIGLAQSVRMRHRKQEFG